MQSSAHDAVIGSTVGLRRQQGEQAQGQAGS
jgi:hypothetical protein